MPSPDTPLVEGGTPGGRIALVLDPTPEPAARLPESWRAIAGEFEVHWCHLAETGGFHACQHILADAEGPLPRVDVIAAGPATTDALELAASRPTAIRSVLLVNPAEETAPADEAWFRTHGTAVAGLRDTGIDVELVNTGPGASRDDPALAGRLRSTLSRLPAVHRAET